MNPIFYLLISLAIILVMFIALKRPMYEALGLADIVCIVIASDWANVPKNAYATATNYLLYVVIAFISLAVVLEKTGVLLDLIDIVTALVGRFKGGAGYVDLAVTALMGSLSGSGVGSSASVGAIMIPIMKGTGFSAELAATVQAGSSSLGPIIPPSGIIVIVAGLLANLYPGYISTSQFWLCMWGAAIWCILLKLVTLMILIKKYNVQPIPKEDIPELGASLKKGWKACLLPVIILAPFVLDVLLKDTVIKPQLGAAAGQFSTVVLIVVPSLAIFYTLCIAKGNWWTRLPELFGSSIRSITPMAALLFTSYYFANLSQGIGVTEALHAWITGLSIGKWGYVCLIIAIYFVMGCFIDANPVTVMMGEAFILLGVAVGLNPSLVGACLVVVGHGLGQLTPPFAGPLLLSQGIAEADFVGTSKIQIWWIIGQLLLCFLMLGGLLPVFGLVPFDPAQW